MKVEIKRKRETKTEQWLEGVIAYLQKALVFSRHAMKNAVRIYEKKQHLLLQEVISWLYS